MNLFLELGDEFDTFYFSDGPRLNSSHSIKILEENIFTAIQASLSQKKCVYILKEIESFNLINLNIHSKKHYCLEKNYFVFLNFTLKKQIEKLKNQESHFENFQAVENFFSGLNSIFN